MSKKDKQQLQFQNLRKYLIYIAFFIGITAVSLYYIYKFFGKPEHFLIFSSFPWIFIMLLFLMLFIYHILDGLRLYWILKTIRQPVKFLHIFKLVFINLFISNITPFATGGGVAQIYFLKQKGVPLGNATAATTLRTVLATVLIAAAAPVIIMSKEGLRALIPGSSLVVSLLTFILIYSFIFYTTIYNNKIFKKFIYKILHLFNNYGLISRGKFRRLILYIFEHSDLFRENLSLFFQGKIIHVFLTLLSTFLFLLSEFSFAVILLRGMGYQVPIYTIIFLQVLVIFIMYFAPTPGASGVAEGSFSLFFSRLVDKKHIFPLIFSWRLFTKYFGITIGMIIFFWTIYKDKVADL